VERLAPADPDLQAVRSAGLHAAVVPEAEPTAAPVASAPVAAAPPPRAAAPAPAAPVPVPAAARPPSRDQLLGEAALQLSAGDLQGAMERLQAVLAQDPEDLDAHELAYNVYAAAAAAGAPGMVEAQVEQLLNVLRLCKAKAEVARAQPFLDVLLGFNPGHPEVPEFIAVLRPALARPVPAARPQPPAAPATPPVGLGDEPHAPSLVIDVSTTGFHQAPAAAAASPAPSVPVPLGEDVAATRPFNFLKAAAPGEQAAAPRAVTEAVTAVPPQPAQRPGAGQPSAPEAARAPASRPAQRPSANTPAAAAAPAAPPAASGPAAPAAAKRAAAAPAPQSAAPDEAPGRAAATTHAAPLPPPGPEALAARCEQARGLLGQGQYAAGRALAREVLAADATHAWALSLLQWADQVAPEPSPAAAAQPAPESALDLGAQISSELGEALGDVPEAGTGERQVSVEEVFTEFKKGLARVVKPEDVDTHYDLGIAYKEMGLLEDALSEFNVARQGCAGKRKEVDCLAMVALLQAASGQHEAAVQTYAHALRSPHAAGEVQKALLYDLAATREQMGAAGRALTHYLRVLGLDAGYRDVGRVVARLRARVQPEADPLPGPTP